MTAAVTEMIKSCGLCAKYQRSNAQEPYLPHTPPSEPWQRVAMDFFVMRGAEYLLVVDYYSKYVEVEKVPSPLSGGSGSSPIHVGKTWHTRGSGHGWRSSLQ